MAARFASPPSPYIGSNTYEATGVKRVSSSSPVLDRGTGAWFRCFLHSNHSMRAVRRSLLITCEPATARTPMRGDQRLMFGGAVHESRSLLGSMDLFGRAPVREARHRSTRALDRP